MSNKRLVRPVIFTLISILFLAGCTLPTVTPPPGYNPTGAATITAPVPATATPATATSAPNAAAISAANAAQLKAVNKVPDSNVQLLRWSADGNVLALSTQNQDANGNSIFSATLLDGQTLATKTVFSPTDGTIKDISSDGKLVAVVSNDMASMAIYDLSDGNKDIIAYTPGYNIQDVTFSPDQKSYAVSNTDQWGVEIHSLPGGELVKTLTGFQTASPIYTAGYKGSNDTIVWKAHATVQFQDIASGTMGATTSNEDFVGSYELSPDGKILASAAPRTINGATTLAVTLWDVATGSEIKTIPFTDPNNGLDFSADGSLLAVGVGNNVQVIEVSSGKMLANLSGHSAPVSLVAFSPDGKSLASTGQDNQLILWQVTQ